jgi:hypothetical protein
VVAGPVGILQPPWRQESMHDMVTADHVDVLLPRKVFFYKVVLGGSFISTYFRGTWLLSIRMFPCCCLHNPTQITH